MDIWISKPRAVLTKKAFYALKALKYLSKNEANHPILIASIAEEERIPRKFLEAILLELRHSGFLASKKGINGGYYLAKDPKQLSVAEVLQVIDGTFDYLPCIAKEKAFRCEDCISTKVCSIRELFAKLQNITVSTLASASLSDLVVAEHSI